MPAVSMFHKPIKKEIQDMIQKPSRPPRPRPRPPPPQPKAEVSDEPPRPSGPYEEYKIISVARTTWKYDIMKFDARGKEIDPTKWVSPVKLNRKSGRATENEAEPVVVELKPMLGPDGKPVVGMDGKIVMVGPDGKVPQPGSGVNGKVNGKDLTKGKGKGRQPFKKKTRQVHPVSEEQLQLRREEKYPWVMEEGGDNGQVWIGRLDDNDRAKTYALLVPSGQDFQFVPANRWYKFQKKPSYKILALEEAEAEYAKVQKNKDPERWLMRKKAANGAGPSEATLATFKREKSERMEEDEATLLRTVDKGDDDLFGDDEDDDETKLGRKRKEKLGYEGDADEMEYSDEKSDDEEKGDLEAADEETKELEERLKREYRQANKMRDGRIDEDDEDDETDILTGAGKDLKKLVKRTEKNEAYDSDEDEKNPYISEEEELEEVPPQPVTEGPAVMNQIPSQPPSGVATPINRSQTPRPGAASAKPPTTKPIQPTLQGAGSPRATSPGFGNVVVAQRATSPKAPSKPKTRPVAGSSSSRPGSPLASRASSPVPPAVTAPASPPSLSIPTPVNAATVTLPAGVHSLKRKAMDDSPTSGTSTPVVSTPSLTDGKPRKKPKRQLEETMVIDFLRENKETTTKECIQKFQPYLKTEEAKKAFTGMVKKVAVVKKNGTLKLRPEYQEGTPSQ